MTNIAIIGAGITGLTIAYALLEGGAKAISATLGVERELRHAS
ncbi:FAD-dependent oxidoreductase [Bradyrhizobium sp. AS23.2]|nr:FAD-dependent oxidoreductase [Bradyrhizobium sp. AS23.2]